MNLFQRHQQENRKAIFWENSSPSLKFGIVIGLIVLYVLTFPTVINFFGPGGGAVTVIPVLAAGWFFRVRGGLLVGLLILLIYVAINPLVEKTEWLISIDSHHWPGFLMLFTVAWISGSLREGLDARDRSDAKLRSREHYLALLNELSHTLLATQNFDSKIKSMARGLVRLFGADDCFITRWDEEREMTTLLARTLQPEQTQAGSRSVIDSPNLTAHVLQEGNVLAIEDASNSPFPCQEFSAGTPIKSLLVIPLKVGEHKLGAAVVAFHVQRQFAPEQIERAEQAGSQVAIALWDAQQDEDIQQKLREANALAKISLALSETERVGQDSLLQIIVDSAVELISGAEQAVIHILDETQQVLIPQAVTGINEPRQGRNNLSLGEGVAGQVLASGQGINIADINSDPRFLPMGRPVTFHSLLVTPVGGSGRRLGTISVQSPFINAFSAQECQLLSALGVQAAIAIENSHLLDSVQQSLKETNALYEINKGLANSLDSEELLQDVVDLLQQNFGYYHVQIYTLDTVDGQSIFRHGSGEIGEQLKNTHHQLPAGTGIVGHAAETGMAFVTNNVDDVMFFIRNPFLPDTQSELAMPIKIDGRVIAVLDIQQVPPGRLTQRDLNLMSAVVIQLAVALQKANLYANLLQALQHEKAAQNQLIQNEKLALVGRLLASVSHELNNPLQAIQNALFLLAEENNLSEQGRQDLEIVFSETERMALLIDRLRASYRSPRTDSFKPVYLNKVIEEVYALTTTLLRHKNISFQFHADPDLRAVPGFTDQIRQVILNLLINAVEAMNPGGQLSITTKQLQEEGRALLVISDTGPGIAFEILPYIFDAFVTNKESGTGLGLSITYDIIRNHNGKITAENNPDQGAKFSIWLPSVTEEPI